MPMERQIPDEVVKRDQSLRSQVTSLAAKREHVKQQLGELRYHWCATEGWTYSEYGRAVGRSPSAIQNCVVGYAARNGLSVVSETGLARRKGTQGRQPSDAAVTRSAHAKRTKAKEPRAQRIHKVSVKVSEAELEAIKGLAAQRECSVSALLRDLAITAVTEAPEVSTQQRNRWWARRPAA